MDNPADFEQLFFVMHHFRAREAGDGIILSKENRLLWANLLAHPAENAADHVDIELLRIFLDSGEVICGRDFAGNNLDRAWRTNEFAELTRDAADAAILISNQCRRTAVVIRQTAVRFFLGILHRDLGASEQHVLEVLKCNGESGDDSGQIKSFAPVQSRSWNSNGHEFLNGVVQG